MRGAKKFLAWMAALSLVTGFTFSGNTLYAATNSDWEDVSDDDWEDADDDWEDADAPELNVDSATLKVGGMYKLFVDGDYDSISWTTNNKGVATVSSNGTVKANGSGVATITATVKCTEYDEDSDIDDDEYDEYDEYDDDDQDYYAQNYSDDFDDDTDDVFDEDNDDYDTDDDEDDSDDYDADDSFDDNDYLDNEEDMDDTDDEDVSEGTEVTYRLTCQIRVKAPNVKLNATKVTLKKGKTKKLSVKGAGKANVKWATSKKAVAKVSAKGVVTGLKKGKTVIKAKVYGKTLKCNVTVKK